MVNLPGRLVDFSNQNDEMTSLVDSEYQKNDHKKVLNEDAFNRPEILNNRVLFERIRNWRTFSLVFLAFSVLQVVIEGLSTTIYSTITRLMSPGPRAFTRESTS